VGTKHEGDDVKAQAAGSVVAIDVRAIIARVLVIAGG
jgi:hypothetical protein